jgi:hypothetical protein
MQASDHLAQHLRKDEEEASCWAHINVLPSRSCEVSADHSERATDFDLAPTDLRPPSDARNYVWTCLPRPVANHCGVPRSHSQ